MRYLALACDYDGTLATDGQVGHSTVKALERVRASGRKLLLVTGRELPDLATVFPALSLFHRVVAENGGVLYSPASRVEQLLGAAPPEKFIEILRHRKVQPLSVGRVIVAAREPNQSVVLDAIHELGLELQIIFNKGAVMVLPAGVNKATGLASALRQLHLSPSGVVGVGDAENDHSLLAQCGYRVAVANALPMLKESADLVTRSPEGAGVAEVIELLLSDNLPNVRREFGRRESRGTDLSSP
jgi:HAD superfamily hydrolase (TIGR01484 family)